MVFEVQNMCTTLFSCFLFLNTICSKAQKFPKWEISRVLVYFVLEFQGEHPESWLASFVILAL